MKKIISIILSLALLFSLLPCAFAEEAEVFEEVQLSAEAEEEASSPLTEHEVVEEYLNRLYDSGKISGGMPSLAAVQSLSANRIFPYDTMRDLSRLSGAVQDLDYVIYNYEPSPSVCYYVVIYAGNAMSGQPTDAWEYPSSDFPVGTTHLGISWNTAGESYPNGSYTAYSFLAQSGGAGIEIDEESFMGFEIELTGEARELGSIALLDADTGERYYDGDEISLLPNALAALSIELDPSDTTDSRTVQVGCSPQIENLSAYELGGTVFLETGDCGGSSGTLQVTIGSQKVFSFPLSVSLPLPENSRSDLIKRMYDICLGRKPSIIETTYYLWLLEQKNETGTNFAYRFLFSKEFSSKNYCNKHFVAKLYEAMMGRTAAENELDNWIWRLQKGESREEIFNAFAASREFDAICTSYRIPVGSAVEIPEHLARPGGYCTVTGCTEHEKKVAFAKRLYNVCLDREPSQKEIDSWHYYLVHGNHTAITASKFFLFSDEFVNKGYSDEEFVKHLYNALLDRNGRYSADELAYWTWLLSDMGMTREEVFDMFASKDEFLVVCQKYDVVA